VQSRAIDCGDFNDSVELRGYVAFYESAACRGEFEDSQKIEKFFVASLLQLATSSPTCAGGRDEPG
jgi:hypothetical protein